MNAHTTINLATTEAPDSAQFFVFREPSADEKKRDLTRAIAWGRSRYATAAADKALRKRVADGTLKNPRKHIDHLPAALGATKVQPGSEPIRIASGPRTPRLTAATASPGDHHACDAPGPERSFFTA